MISVLILTKNEAQDLPGCLKSVSWSDDIHVFDSCSTDGTQQIAKDFGATVTERPFDDWSTHQNWGLAHLAFRHQWVLYVDADERPDSRLVASLQAAVCNPGENVAFEVQRRDFFLGRWLRHVQATAWYVRLFRPSAIRYERLVNPVTIVSGQTARLEGFLDHHPFSKGVDFWFDRHNRYSSLEARQVLDEEACGVRPGVLPVLRARGAQRRREIKRLAYRLPGRPLIKFLWLYIWRRGFLDGRAGYLYARMVAVYENMISIKVKAARLASRRSE